jgi:hypothetical protein
MNKEKLRPIDHTIKVGDVVQTRMGLPTRILCTDVKDPVYTIVAAILRDDGKEMICSFSSIGEFTCGETDVNDLFFAPVKRTGWVNRFQRDNSIELGKIVYKSEEEAIFREGDYPYYKGTTKIEWYE